MNEEFFGYLLGNLSVAFLSAYFIFAGLGALLNMTLHYKKRPSKEKAFSLKYWFANNWNRVLAGFILIFVFAVGFDKIEWAVKPFFDSLGMPYELTTITGLFIGYYIDKLLIKFKNRK